MDERMWTDWIWTPEWTMEDDQNARIVYFRREMSREELRPYLPLKITADSRYKLYVNGVFAQEGPQKGDLTEWYLDTANIESLLQEGMNTLAVEVLRYPETPALRNRSLHRTSHPCLYIEGLTRRGWKCRKAVSVRFHGEPFYPAPLYITEEAEGDADLAGWKLTGYDDGIWEGARPYTALQVILGESPFNLVARTIPPQRHKACRFIRTVCVREPEGNQSIQSTWDALVQMDLAVIIPPHTTQIVELDAGELTSGYLSYAFTGGANSQWRVVTAECYGIPQPPRDGPFGPLPQPPLKGDREDHIHGRITGITDNYRVNGFGTEARPEEYEPYWFRTFRFLRVEIVTEAEPLTIRRMDYRETGYPLDSRVAFESSDQTLKDIWDISLRTLRRCMHETYLDCPYYEQLQYAMDSRSEILFTYHLSMDDRLARQCMDAFRRSQRPDGMINSCAPTIDTNVIPGFSIYYLLMVYDHMMYFGDPALVREHMPALMRILDFFDTHRTEKGLVGSVGGPIMRNRYWSFIDWAKQWNENAGVPSACLQGDRSLTMESLLYLMGLQKATELAEYIGLSDASTIYRDRAKELSDCILRECAAIYTEQDGTQVTLLQDGPGVPEYSAHCQTFAVLTGLVDQEQGRRMLGTALKHREWPQCSVSMMFYLFRALEVLDWYEKADEQWELWRRMVRNHMTTCVENDTDARSDCHAWSAILLYEMPAVYLGVRPAAPGYAKVSIRPVMGHLTRCEGEVPTPRGMIHVAWTRTTEGECDLHFEAPENVVILQT